MKIKRVISLIALLCCCISLTSFSASAASKAQGFAVYSNGFTDWSGGLMNGTTVDSVGPIIEYRDGGVNYSSLTTFRNGYSFIGYYLPFSNIDANGLQLVLNTAKELATKNISKSNINAINYKTSSAKVKPGDITSMNSIGLIEYSYEYNGYRVYGNEDTWDISKNSLSNVTAHAFPILTAKKQAILFMKNCLGDADYSHSVTSADARLVLRCALDLETFDSYQTTVSDVDGDGKVSSADSRLVFKYSLKEITRFPADPYNDYIKDIANQ